jgi:hypothetical protein
MKRGGTMTMTAAEGKAFLESEGHRASGRSFNCLTNLDSGIQTRGQKNTMDVVEELLEPKERKKVR